MSSPLSSDESEPHKDPFAAASHDASQKKQRRASVQSLTSMEARNNDQPVDKYALFASIKETNWTVADHHRLYAIDRLQTRIMEYHNNVHRRENFIIAASNGVRSDDVVAFLMTCSASHMDKPFQPIEKGQLLSTMKGTKAFVKNKQGGGLQWIHMMDLSALPIIADELQLDELCQTHFRDLRFHSMKMPLLGGCCLSLCYFQLDPFTLSVGMFKLYFYVTNKFVLTFVAELMPDVDPSQRSTGAGTKEDNDGHAVQELMQLEDSEMPVPIDAVFNAVVDRWESLADRAAELGPMLVFYELAAEALSAQDSLMEFLSRSIFHFKRKTSFRLSYRKKLQLVKRLHIVGTAISMVESCTAKAALVLDGLVHSVMVCAPHHTPSVEEEHGQGNSRHGVLALDALVPSSVLGVRQLPLLIDLQNSYSFVHSCLVNEAREVGVVSAAIESISQMRADNTALSLSLIATLFLPATFLTGVFGMNFQVNGGYTIQMVNSEYGPRVFYALCFLLAVVLSLYYMHMGWIEAFSFIRYVLNLFVGKKTMITMLGEDFDEDLNDDPDVKHPKLVSVAGMEQSGTSEREDSVAGASGVVRSPLSASGVRMASNGEDSGARRAGAGGGQRSMLVPERVAEALEEEGRRNEEARRRRELAQLQGMQPSTSLGVGTARGSLAMRPTLLHRYRASTSRASASADGSATASAVRK